MNIVLGEMFNGKGGGLPPHEGAKQLGDSINYLGESTKKAAVHFVDFNDTISGSELVKQKLKPTVDALTQSFTDFAISSAQSFKSVGANFKAMIADLLDQAARALLSRALQSLFAMLLGGIGGAPATGFAHFGGPRQFGGRVQRGVPHMVGERGREMFVPDTAGKVFPNDALGGGKVINNFFNAPPIARQQKNETGGTDTWFDNLLATTLANPRSMANKALAGGGRGPPMKQR
jgi:hypothetical protein